MEKDELSKYLVNNASFSTQAIHVGSEPEKWMNSELMPPISLATTFKQDIFAKHPKKKVLFYLNIKYIIN